MAAPAGRSSTRNFRLMSANERIGAVKAFWPPNAAVPASAVFSVPGQTKKDVRESDGRHVRVRENIACSAAGRVMV